jgi:hypothetical protein
MIADFVYAAGSPDCRLNVGVPVLVLVKHMTMATLLLRTCITRDYSPALFPSQENLDFALKTPVTCWLDPVAEALSPNPPTKIPKGLALPSQSHRGFPRR